MAIDYLPPDADLFWTSIFFAALAHPADRLAIGEALAIENNLTVVVAECNAMFILLRVLYYLGVERHKCANRICLDEIHFSVGVT